MMLLAGWDDGRVNKQATRLPLSETAPLTTPKTREVRDVIVVVGLLLTRRTGLVLAFWGHRIVQCHVCVMTNLVYPNIIITRRVSSTADSCRIVVVVPKPTYPPWLAPAYLTRTHQAPSPHIHPAEPSSAPSQTRRATPSPHCFATLNSDDLTSSGPRVCVPCSDGA